MRNETYRNILVKREQNHKMVAVLLDPDKCKDRHIVSIISMLKSYPPDFVFVGGRHTILSTNSLIEILQEELSSKIVLFPGDASQFSDKADALLLLSLFSGRNPEYLIGQHVNSAIGIRAWGVEVIPTAYILVEGGKTSAVEYMSNTRAIPRNKKDIAVSTAVAGELLGMRLTYLEAGSGAQLPVPTEMIQAVRHNLDMPLIVGGGISTPEAMMAAFEAGADLVVIGNAFESQPQLIPDFAQALKKYNEKEEI